ncbi:MAG: hypothetical protein LBQ98_06230 [Nitrososphaerota archaeon]|nr:hypothetical protein [Nitrososphaerota archaeon]
MNGFCLNSAKTYLGKNVNLHLKDGAVIVNVHLVRFHSGIGRNNKQLEYHLSNHKPELIPLKSVAYAKILNLPS